MQAEKLAYEMPNHGWTCFHCGVNFRDPHSARRHFGLDPEAVPACLIDPEHVSSELQRFRFVESKLREVRDELIDIRALGDGAPFLPADHTRTYNVLTKAIDAIMD